MDAKTVFRCHQLREDAIWFAELGASRSLLDAGYNIASFMTRCEWEMIMYVLHTQKQRFLMHVDAVAIPLQVPGR
jgi:hypothetical protein